MSTSLCSLQNSMKNDYKLASFCHCKKSHPRNLLDSSKILLEECTPPRLGCALHLVPMLALCFALSTSTPFEWKYSRLNISWARFGIIGPLGPVVTIELSSRWLEDEPPVKSLWCIGWQLNLLIGWL